MGIFGFRYIFDIVTCCLNQKVFFVSCLSNALIQELFCKQMLPIIYFLRLQRRQQRFLHHSKFLFSCCFLQMFSNKGLIYDST